MAPKEISLLNYMHSIMIFIVKYYSKNLETIPVSGKFNSLIISQHIQMNIIEFNRLNPNFDKLLAANSSYDLRLPADKALLFQANKPQILEGSIKLLLTTVNNKL